MKKTRKSVIALFLTFVLMAGCMLPLFGFPIGARDVMPDTPEAFDSFYYISDDPQSSTRYQDLLDATALNGHYCYLGNFSTSNTPELQVQAYMQSIGTCAYQSISNAYVIFEIQKRFTRVDTAVNEPELPAMLNTIFSTLQENNCRIMFISGTDEALYAPDYNYFLEYVDVHVNVDIWYTFMSTIFYKAYLENGQQSLHNITFILDRNLSNEIEDIQSLSNTLIISNNEPFKNYWFINNYIITYLCKQYAEEIRQNNWTYLDLLNETNIKIICHMNENTFYDVTANERIVIDEIDTNDLCGRLFNEYIYAIGYADSGYSYSANWLDLIQTIKNDCDLSFPVYLFNPLAYTFDSYNSLFTAGAPTDIYPVMLAFLQNMNMSSYNNWSGLCLVTHKALNFGPNGWLIDTVLNGFLLSEWLIYQPEAEW